MSLGTSFISSFTPVTIDLGAYGRVHAPRRAVQAGVAGAGLSGTTHVCSCIGCAGSSMLYVPCAVSCCVLHAVALPRAMELPAVSVAPSPPHHPTRSATQTKR